MRPTAQLAANVWDPRLETAVGALIERGTGREVKAAQRLMVAVDHKHRSVSGADRRGRSSTCRN